MIDPTVEDVPIVVGDGPNGVGVNSNTNMIYVSNSFDNTVTVIDGSDNNSL